MRARSELRARRAWLGLALIAALGAGAVMTAAVGARRTDRAYGRFDRTQQGADMVIAPSFGEGLVAPPFDQVTRLAQVKSAGRLYLMFATQADTRPISVVYGEAPVETEIDRPKLLHGRRPRAADEVAVGFAFADSQHLHVGSRLAVRFAPKDFTGGLIPRTLRVVGIEASPGEFPPQFENSFGTNLAHLSPAGFASLSREVFMLQESVVRLRHGAADIPAFTDGLHRLVGGQPEINLIRSQQAANVQRSIHLQAVALWVLGGLLGLVTVGVISQLLARQASVEATEHETLRALGMARSQLFALGMARTAATGLVAAVVGAGLAILASPLTPIGTARIAELHPGITVDWKVLLLGGLVTLALVLVVSAWPVWRATAVAQTTRAAERAGRPPVLARATAVAALPPTIDAGVRMAVEPGRGRTAVPVRSSLLAVVVAVAALVGTISFAASLDRLLSTPRLYGWNWDAHLSGNGDQATADAAIKAIGNDPRVQDLVSVDTPPMAIGNVGFDAVILRQEKGSIQPVVLAGRTPHGPDEVALGTETMRKVHAHIGSTVSMRVTAIEPFPKTFQVVGRVVLRPLSDTSRLGSGAVLDAPARQRLIPPQVHAPDYSELDLRLVPGVDKARTLADFEKRLNNDFDITTPKRPADLVNFGRVQNLPVIFGAIVGLLGAATLAQTLLTSVRRRRRDLAVLKTLGFSCGQVRRAVAWQATTFAAVALAIGLPLGAAAGRLVWRAFAEHLGVVSEPVTPPLLLLVMVPAAVLVANLIAAVPAWIAGQMRPALALRTE